MDYIKEIAPIITALVLAANCWQTYRNGQKANKIAADVKDVKTQTDGINASLVKVTGEKEFAKGLKQGEDSRDEPVKVEIVKIPSAPQPR